MLGYRVEKVHLRFVEIRRDLFPRSCLGVRGDLGDETAHRRGQLEDDIRPQRFIDFDPRFKGLGSCRAAKRDIANVYVFGADADSDAAADMRPRHAL